MMNSDEQRRGQNNSYFWETAGTLGGGGMTAFPLRNMYQQYQAMNNSFTFKPESRLSAFMATSRFPSGTVGYGVHAAIANIHGLFGSFGEHTIGNLFNSEAVQALASKSINSPANLSLATMEHAAWTDTARTATSLTDRIGGMFGSMATPDLRASIQSQFAHLRTWAPRFVPRSGPVAAVVGGATVLGKSLSSAYEKQQSH